MRRSIFACGLLLALAGIPSAFASVPGGDEVYRSPVARNAPAPRDTTDYWNAKAQRAQAVTVRWMTVVRGRPPQQAPHHQSSNSSPLAAYGLWRTWHQRAVAAAQLAKNPPNLEAWNCIHSHEGSWSDPNAPYWGGLQMDMNFQAAYGPWLLKHEGTANHWTPLQQIWTGVRAWRVRGFEPWSTTAHACGVY
jgi:hypothetical protein